MTEHRKVDQASGGEERIRRQAELLAAARHPGVVEVVGVEGSSERPVLVTALVDGPTLAAPLPLAAEEVAGVVGAVAATLADLHQMGIVHGAVVPEHVIVGPGGRPVLCGFGSAGRTGEAGPSGDEELQPATDVAALGRVLRRLATGPDARALRRVAEAATADDPAARPSARAMAAELAAAVPGSRLPSQPAPDLRSLVAGARAGRRRPGTRGRRSPGAGGARSRALAGGGLVGILGTEIASPADGEGAGGDPDGDERVGPGARGTTDPYRPPPVPTAHRRRLYLPAGPAALVASVGAMAAVALVVIARWSSPGPSGPSDPTPAPPVAAAAPSTRVSPTSTLATPSSTVPTVGAGCLAPTSVLVADVDGDGCLDALNYADGVLEAAGQRWSLGRAGDQVATGDWSCRGTRTVVLLRPSTGEVFRFDAWAVGAVETVTGAEVATVPGGQAVRAADVDRDGCHELVVERGELPPQVVRLPRVGP